MNKIKTLGLLLSLTTTSVFSANYEEFVKISDGHYAKIALDGTVTEIATTAEVSELLEKDMTLTEKTNLKNTILNSSSTGTTDGSYLCIGKTEQRHTINLVNNSISVFGSANFGHSLTPPPPYPQNLQSNIRIRAKIRAYDANDNYIAKKLTISRNFVDDLNQANQSFTNLTLWNFVDTTAVMPLTANIARVDWAVVSEFMVDAPSSLDINDLNVDDCYETQKIRVINVINL